MTAEDTTAIYLWAALGDPNQCPDRVQVAMCEHCAVLVVVERGDRHIRWHRRNEGVVELPGTPRQF